ncbi:hypothetical protein PT7_2591 [Pusillimonas sp. T7-7]|nr:hypothetical protein PT7_2591 [Pusillimonas sp. T7-7]
MTEGNCAAIAADVPSVDPLSMTIIGHLPGKRQIEASAFRTGIRLLCVVKTIDMRPSLGIAKTLAN